MTGSRLYRKYTRKSIGDRVRPYGWLFGAAGGALILAMPIWMILLGII